MWRREKLEVEFSSPVVNDSVNHGSVMRTDYSSGMMKQKLLGWGTHPGVERWPFVMLQSLAPLHFFHLAILGLDPSLQTGNCKLSIL